MITDKMMEAACAATGHTLHPEDVRKALEAALKAAQTQAEEVTDEYLEKLWEQFSEESDWEHTIPWTSFNRGYRWALADVSSKLPEDKK